MLIYQVIFCIKAYDGTWTQSCIMLFLYCGLQYSKVEEKKNNKEEKNKEERLLDKDQHRKGGLLGRKFPRGVCYIKETTSHCMRVRQRCITVRQTWALEQHCSTIYMHIYCCLLLYGQEKNLIKNVNHLNCNIQSTSHKHFTSQFTVMSHISKLLVFK